MTFSMLLVAIALLMWAICLGLAPGWMTSSVVPGRVDVALARSRAWLSRSRLALRSRESALRTIPSLSLKV